MKKHRERHNGDVIHIVFNIDDRFARHCGVTISSVIRNNPARAIHFHILGLDVSEKNKERLRRVAGRKRPVTFYDVDPALVNELPYLGEHTSIAAASYVRLFLTDFLSEEIGKVLYLDCDTLVLQSLDELWDIDLSGYALAAVEDVITYSDHWLDHDDSVGYFNAGVMLINLRYWRENNAKDRFMSFLSRYSDQIRHHDQDALNGVFYDRKLLIENKWNTFPRFCEKKYREEYPEYEKICSKDPCIVHFTGRKKPWNTRSYHLYFPRYYLYQLFTPWKFRGPSKKKCRK